MIFALYLNFTLLYYYKLL